MNALVKTMQQAALAVLPHAYAPYSGYQVACCLATDQGSLFTGVNVENIAYSLCFCAESSAIAQMVSNGQRRIRHVVVLAQDDKLCTPCGACRQRISEFALPDCQIHLCNSQQVLNTLSVDELLPFAFTFTKLDKS
ncbi:MAG: cytidine deaminase [Legionellaceae bacterium]|nr:cytidine deaminase [Legionellaceae bacterium]